jgi:AcrR family transcriptional regulator
VYSNFAAKEDLFFAVYERAWSARSASSNGRSPPPRPGGWIESVIADTSRRRGRDDRWLSTFFEFWAHVVRRPALRERFATIHARLERPFVAALERHADDHRAQTVASTAQVHLAMTAMSLGLTLERLIRPRWSTATSPRASRAWFWTNS